MMAFRNLAPLPIVLLIASLLVSTTIAWGTRPSYFITNCASTSAATMSPAKPASPASLMWLPQYLVPRADVLFFDGKKKFTAILSPNAAFA